MRLLGAAWGHASLCGSPLLGVGVCLGGFCIPPRNGALGFNQAYFQRVLPGGNIVIFLSGREEKRRELHREEGEKRTATFLFTKRECIEMLD